MATLDDVARAAGVSKVTVSNVLNGRNKEAYPSAVRRADEIRHIAASLGYRPNAAAKSVRTGRFGAVGLLLSSEPNASVMFDVAWRSILGALHEHDLHLNVGDLPDDKLTDERFVPKLLRELAADGLLINYIADIPPQMDRLIRRHRIPSVWMNARLEADCVFPDDRGNAYAATRRLLEMGHTRVAYLDLSVSSHYSAAEREAGYSEAMAEAGLTPRPQRAEGATGPDAWQARCSAFLAAPGRPTAVLTYEAYHAVPLYVAALRAGLDVPRDLSILTFHHQPVGTLGIPMDTMEIPAAAMGEQAVRMLYRRMEQPGLSLPPLPLPGRLVPGATCAAPPRPGERVPA